MRGLISIIAAACALCAPAKAATTVYASGVYQTSGLVFGSGNAIGATDSSSATLFPFFGVPSSITLIMSQAITGASASFVGQRLTAGSNVEVAIGEVVGGTTIFSTFTSLPGGAGPTAFAVNLGAACSAISATGCSLLRIRVSGGFGSGFNLNGVSGVASAPEPSIWGLMILGFGVTTWRLRNARSAVAKTLA